jgi:outer membrane receptor protein involved in Fe transport
MHMKTSRGLLLVALLVIASPALAQLPTSSLRGVVVDAQQAILPGATVTATQLGTGLTRTTVTNASGEYRLSGLPSGLYEVVVELGGFQKQTRRVEVLLNQEAEIGFTLGLQVQTEVVNVLAETPMVETTKSEVSRTWKEEQIRDLPLPGRNFLNLMLNAPGVTTGGTGASGFGAAVNGQRSRQVNFLIDGSDNNDASVTGNRSPIIQDAVGEFRIVTTLFPAELGRNTGAVAIASTKSGTNVFRGTAYEFYENAEKLNARTNIETAANAANPAVFQNPGKLRRDTYGFSIGGPVQRNKMFFFGAYQRVPFEAAGAAPAISSVTQEGRAILATIAGVDRRMLELFEQYIPLPNSGAVRTTTVAGVTIPVQDYVATLPNTNLNNQTVLRVDRTVSRSDTVFGRYIYSKTETVGASNPPGFANDSSFPTHNFVATWDRLLGSSSVNEFHFSYGQTGGLFPAGSTNPAGNNDLSTLTIQGFATIGLAVNIPQDRKEKVWQFTDSLSYLRGTHGFKFGADIRRVDLTSFVPFDFRGTYTYTNLSNFMLNNPATVVKVYGDPQPTFKYTELALFAQDDWRIKPRLTLNLGLRYERVPAANGFYSNVKTDNNNVSPRTGFAWDVKGDGRSVVRGGYGLTYDQFFLNIPLLAQAVPPFQRRIQDTTGSTRYPSLPGDRDITPAELKTLGVTDIPDDAQFPMGHQWQIGYQRQLRTSWRAEAAYIGSLGRHLIRQRVVNPVVCCPREVVTGPTGALANRRFGDPLQTGQITSLEPAAKSEYHSGQFSIEKRFNSGNSFSAAYTYSRFYDDGSESLATGTPSLQRPQNNFDFGAEWALSSFDRPHRFVASGLYQVPFRKEQRDILGYVLGGWSISATWAIQSGQPFTIITGVDSNGDGDPGNDRPDVNSSGDPTKFSGYIQRGSLIGGHGNLGRNTGRGPRLNNVNGALFKNFRIVADHQVQIRGEFFNLLNHRQFVLRTDGRERNLSNPEAQFMDFTSSNGGSRTVILGLKYIF